MNEHDVVHVIDSPGDSVVTCACGLSLEAPTVAEAREKHSFHYGLAAARSALEVAKRR